MNVRPSDSEEVAKLSSRFVSLVGRRWSVDVLVRLDGRGRRYQEIHDALDGISYKVLTEALRRAERDGLISRHLDSDRVETATLYKLTDLGESVIQQMVALAEWAAANWATVDAARKQWDATRKGRRS